MAKCCASLMLLTLFALAPQAKAQQAAAELKAQILVKILRFVEWPPTVLAAGQSLQLCLLEDGSLAQQLMELDGQTVNARALRVRAQRNRSLAGCHLALVGAVLPGAAYGTLLVGEDAMPAEKGLMLTLLVEDGRVVFDIDLDAARRSGIEFSARLLRLARYVRKT